MNCLFLWWRDLKFTLEWAYEKLRFHWKAKTNTADMIYNEAIFLDSLWKNFVNKKTVYSDVVLWYKPTVSHWVYGKERKNPHCLNSVLFGCFPAKESGYFSGFGIWGCQPTVRASHSFPSLSPFPPQSPPPLLSPLSFIGVGAQSTLGGHQIFARKYVLKISKMPEFYVIIARKIFSPEF